MKIPSRITSCETSLNSKRLGAEGFQIIESPTYPLPYITSCLIRIHPEVISQTLEKMWITMSTFKHKPKRSEVLEGIKTSSQRSQKKNTTCSSCNPKLCTSQHIFRYLFSKPVLHRRLHSWTSSTLTRSPNVQSPRHWNVKAWGLWNPWWLTLWSGLVG